MALDGTLDTFALGDVIRLLAATRKTGCLRVSGERGNGSAWFQAGSVVAVEADHAPHATEPGEALFELLRLTSGEFRYQADVSDRSGPAMDAESLLAGAEAQLAEWQSISAVVPSLESWLTLRPHLTDPAVTIDQDRWAAIVAVGSGITVRGLGERLALPELPICRAVKSLVEAGLVDLEPREPAPTPPLTRRLPVALDLDQPVPASPPHIDLPSVEEPAELDVTPTGLAAAFPGLASHARPTAPDADEVSRHLATLTPEAAEVVRAAVDATSEEEREAVLAAADADGAPLNRGLLLKFLSSVKT